MDINKPLADYFRPESFEEMAGQENLVGEKGVFRKIFTSENIPSSIFFGPPGTGKTTASNIIAKKTNKHLFRLNATTASLSDIKDVVKSTEGIIGSNGVLLYLDEIQYFNKKQQQSLLQYVEDGSLTLIASTTENPYFYIYPALLSRCQVFEFKSVTPVQIKKRLLQVLDKSDNTGKLSDEAIDMISVISAGDVRKSLNYLELSLSYYDGKILEKDDLESLLPAVSMGLFDKNGDVHYNLLSCLQKSIRGSDPDAALFYLAKLLEGGDLLSPCRRLLVIASEDIGPAYPMAAVVTKACVDSARELGLPEGRIPLANAVIILATAPKSNSAEEGIIKASSDVEKGLGQIIPEHLRSPLFKGYKYPHAYPNHFVHQQYLPNDVKDSKYYIPGDNKLEKASEEYLRKIKEK